MVASTVRVIRLAHVHYQHPDLQKALTFLDDFGMVVEKREEDVVYLRGYGVQPYVYVASQSPDHKQHFLGATWVVASMQDLEAAAALPTAEKGGIKENMGPGGGKMVTVTDPNGNFVHFIFGQTMRSVATSSDQIPRLETTSAIPNTVLEKSRKGDFRRFKQGASPVHKLGHYGYIVPKARFEETLKWYTTIMNLKPTDTIFDPVTGKDDTCFTHIDLGAEYTDHHSFFVASSPTAEHAHVHHSSFELNDFDTQLLGHDWLRSKPWTNCWGVGRHVLGSQIFDYWFDASGNILEHYSDGDLVNENTPEKREPAAPDSLFVWGPNVPLGFLTGRIEDAGIPLPIPGPPSASEGEKAIQEPVVAPVNGAVAHESIKA